MIKKLTPLRLGNLLNILLLAIPFLLNAQLADDFSDGDFSANPEWSGTTSLFRVNDDFQLQLNATEAGEAWLSTPYTESAANIEWRFYIRLAFSPSGSNYGEVYLSADNENLNEPLNGYFLRFGEAGSEDAIELFRKEGTETTSILRGTSGLLASSFAMWVRIIRSADGDWELFVDPDGSGIFSLEASGSDNMLQPGGFFGFYVDYTVSNSTKAYFDEVYAGPEIVDTDAPQLLSAKAVDPFTVVLDFDEALAEESALQAANFVADNGLGQPESVEFGANRSQLELHYLQQFENGYLYSLNITNMEDLAENVSPDIATHFSYYEAAINDVVINEIMADPSPYVGLPEWEFVELFNRTDFTIDLEGWQLQIGSTPKEIGQVQLLPNGYLILCHEDGAPAMGTYGAVFGFSSLQLTNSGTSLTLISRQGANISSVAYTDKWYNDPAKADGGWTIEQIDPDNPCGGQNNWTASVSPDGGTPGGLNAVDAPNVFAPRIERFQLLSETIIQLWFDQQMDLASLAQTNFYTVESTGEYPVLAATNPADGSFVELVFDRPFEQGNIYKLLLSENLTNCAGLSVESGSFVLLGLPDDGTAGDVLINEVLFNPLGDGVDYVELYNFSDKVLDLNQLWLGNIRQTIPNPPDTTLVSITDDSYLLLPASYALLTTNKNLVLGQFQTSDEAVFVETASFPTYSNGEGAVLLKARSGEIVDIFSYNEDMHYPLLTTNKGVALERISFDSPTNDRTNWHSAAESVGFGTPGLQNSMFKAFPETDGAITIEPELFSPDGDGIDDVTSIAYNFEEAGYTLNIYLFNAAGQQIRHLVKSQLVAREGVYNWDGVDDSGNKTAVGIYIVYVEVFDLEGNVKAYKKPVVVATR
ncbi:MAG: lamin tail domain-containing protein [Bacteroidetes bacterium]|nr:lamin tail domain-containing protein [Bacteroidota bacterium]